MPSRGFCDQLLFGLGFKLRHRGPGLERVRGLCVTVAWSRQERVDKAGNDGIDGDSVLPQLQNGLSRLFDPDKDRFHVFVLMPAAAWYC
jgi:hypothetical protein